MEKFNICIDDKEFQITTSHLKGNGKIEFHVFDGDNLLVTLSPILGRNKRFSWASSAISGRKEIAKKSTRAIGRAIVDHYGSSEY